ncbi:MAG: C25 family cysteine peptidase [Calditrichota bacterium]
MRSALLILISILFAVAAPVIAAQAPANSASNWEPEFRTAVRASGNSLHIDWDVPSAARDLNSRLQVVNQIGELNPVVGLPPNLPLPAITRWVVVPDGGPVRLEIADHSTARWSCDLRDGSLKCDSEDLANAVEADLQLYPPQSAKIGKEAYYRGLRLIPVTIYPVQAQPGTDKVWENRRLEITLTVEPGASRNSAKPRSFARHWRALEGIVLNPPARDLASETCARMLILRNAAYNNQNGLTAINEFADWKRRMGLQVDIVTVNLQNQDQDDIKTIVREAYLDEDAPLDYLLIIGWDDMILGQNENIQLDNNLAFPTFSYNIDEAQIYGDLLFTTFDGDDDLIQDVQFGRILVPETEALRGVLRRQVLYESDPFAGPQGHENEWFNHAVIASDHDVLDDDPAFMRRFNLMNYETKRLPDLGYNDIDSVWQMDRLNPDHYARPRAIMEEGVSLALGDGWILGARCPLPEDNPDPNTARNGRMNPFCVANQIHYRVPITARWFHKATLQEIHGPIAVYGYSGRTIADTYVEYIHDLIGWTLRGMIHQGLTEGGSLHLNANLGALAAMRREPGTDDVTVRQNMALCRYTGDPSLDPFTSVPVRLTAELPQSINLGATFVGLTIEDGDGNPVSGARVTIRQGNRFHYVASSAGDGMVGFTIPAGLAQGTVEIAAFKHNHRPLLASVNVTQAQVNLVLQQGGFDDSGGDNDDSLRNGETVVMTLILANNGGQAAQNVTVNFSTDSPYLQFSRESAPLANIAAGGAGTLAQAVNMTLSADCPGGTVIQVRAIPTLGEQTWPIAFEFTSVGPRLEAVAPNQVLIPDQQANVNPTLRNRGDRGVSASAVTLVSFSDGVTITEAERAFAAIAPGANANPQQPFVIQVAPWFIQGNNARFELQVTAQDNHHAAKTFELRVGEREVTDPLGPNEGSYVCYDSGDRSYAGAPVFNWIEINPNHREADLPGRRIRLNEMNQAWNASALIDLPFPFTFYGEEFRQAVVCSNGWMALGDEAEGDSSKFNAPIPGPNSPQALIAAFWQDLLAPSSGFDGVFSAFDEEHGLFIVEWSQAQVQTNTDPFLTSNETFEIILFDPELYRTPTGDGDIVIQYLNVEPVAGFEFYHRWPTVGISSPDGRTGLQYTHGNEYPVPAARLDSLLAIKFTTNTDNLKGGVRGRVVRAEAPDQPIPGAVVDPLIAPSVSAGQDGWFLLSDIPSQAYERVVVRAEGFNNRIVSFEIPPDSTIELADPIGLTHPLPFVQDFQNPLRLSLRPDGHRTQAFVSLGNRGNGRLEFQAAIRYPDGSEATDSIRFFDSLSVIIPTRPSFYGAAYIPELRQFFIPGIESGLPPQIYVLDENRAYVRRFTQPVPIDMDQPVFNNLAWDGQLLWGGYTFLGRSYFVSFTVDSIPGDTINNPIPGNPENPIITWSPERGTFFISDHAKNIYEMSREGNIIQEFEIQFPSQINRINAIGWNSFDLDNMPVYFLNVQIQDITNSRLPLFCKLNPETGEYRFVDTLEIRARTPRDYTGLAFINNMDTHVSYMAVVERHGIGGSSRFYLRLHETGPNLSFMVPGSFQGQNGSIRIRQGIQTGFEVDATGWPEDTYEWSYRFHHNAAGGDVIVPVILVVDANAGVGEEGILPEGFSLESVYPNPFNGSTQIGFTLDRAAQVGVRIFDLNGREAVKLDEQAYSAGRHRLSWEANQLPSGIYIVRVEAAGLGFRQTKAVLIK